MDLLIRVKAPFAAFRDLKSQLKSYPIITPTAAWGLLLAAAGIEARKDVSEPVTLTAPDAPDLQLALGQVAAGTVQSLYQQLHAYEVSPSAREKHLRAGCKGAKYHITPKYRDVLVGLDCVLGVRGQAEVLERIVIGLESGIDHYGIPFAGDNNLFLERFEVTAAIAAGWCEAIDNPVQGSFRMPVWNDRARSERNVYQMFRLSKPTVDIPQSAWVVVGPSREVERHPTL
jgi:CRISPR-associated Cas5-like protein